MPSFQTMIEFFRVECAHQKSSPLVKEVHSIRISYGSIQVPGLRAIESDRPLVVIGKSGSEWPDCLASDFSRFPLFFSERMIQGIANAGLTGLSAVEVKMDASKNAKLIRSAERLRFYQVSPLGVAMEFNHRVFERVGQCYEFRFETTDKTDPRLRPTALPYMQQTQRIPLKQSWDGSDFIMVSKKIPIYGSGGFYCTRRFVELARSETWSNLNFTPIDMMGQCVGDFRDLPWPPEKWYPENHPPSAFSSDAAP